MLRWCSVGYVIRPFAMFSAQQRRTTPMVLSLQLSDLRLTTESCSLVRQIKKLYQRSLKTRRRLPLRICIETIWCVRGKTSTASSSFITVCSRTISSAAPYSSRSTTSPAPHTIRSGSSPSAVATTTCASPTSRSCPTTSSTSNAERAS